MKEVKPIVISNYTVDDIVVLTEEFNTITKAVFETEQDFGTEYLWIVKTPLKDEVEVKKALTELKTSLDNLLPLLK